MDTLKPWLSAIELWCHQHDIAPAVILALVFEVIADTVRFGSAIRTMVRIIRNTIAELSEANLRMRIEEQAGVRQRIAAYLTSDNAIYMRAFRLLMKTWFLAVLGLALFLLASLGPYNNSELFRRIVMLQGIAVFGRCNDARAILHWSSSVLDIHCGVHRALVTEFQGHATTKRPLSRDGRSHPLPDCARLGILD